MLEALRFVKGAVARKDFLPVLTHFRIDGGRILGSNGNLSLSSPIDLSLTASPKAETFAAAIANCDDGVAIVQLPNGSLAIKSGTYRAVVECSTDEFPVIKVGGYRHDLPFDILPALKTLQAFVSEDASRPWSQGILFRGKSAFATNNIIVAEYWIGVDIPVEINIPTKVVDEMIRIDEEPEYIEIAPDEEGKAVGITIRYSGDRWMNHPAVGGEWPDASRYLNAPYNYVDFPAEIFPAMEKVKRFVSKIDQAIYFTTGRLCTNADRELGSSVDLEAINFEGKYSMPQLLLLQGVATKIDFTQNPAGFIGEGLRGVIIGMRR